MLSRFYDGVARICSGAVSVVIVVLQAARAASSMKAARTLLAVAMVISVLLVAASPAAAYRLSSARWPSGKDYFTVCISGNIPSFKAEQIRKFLLGGNSPWTDKSQATWGVWKDSDNNCSSFAYDIDVDQEPIGPAAQTVLSVDGSGHIVHAQIKFNSNYMSDFYWGTTVQDCYTGINGGCEMDARTVSLHEFGHALGIAHNTTDTVQRCAWGYYSDAAAQACDLTGTAMMHWNAGAEFINGYAPGDTQQGIRHTYLKQDDKDAIVALFGAP